MKQFIYQYQNNKKYTTMGQQTKTELELREEISGYAASSKNGTIKIFDIMGGNGARYLLWLRNR